MRYSTDKGRERIAAQRRVYFARKKRLLELAAPDMLEALVEARMALRGLTGGSCLVSVENAIKKAEGVLCQRK